MKKYYSIMQTDREADVYIYGDITSWPVLESDVSSYTLSRELQDIDADIINVYINSYGGEVAEGLAIYNMLKRHKALIKTYCDGFACSVASVIFMAGEERIMSPASLLMIHNAILSTTGNAEELRKSADDLETISTVAFEAYRGAVSSSEGELRAMLDAESWIAPDDALAMGFATSVGKVKESDKPTQSARDRVLDIMRSVDNAALLAAEPIAGIDETAEKVAEKLMAKIEPPAPYGINPENKLINFVNALMRG